MARSRRVRLGNLSGAEALRRAGKGSPPLREAIARDANRDAQELAPVVHELCAEGATNLRAQSYPKQVSHRGGSMTTSRIVIPRGRVSIWNIALGVG